jgi:hypothetical protein
LDVAAAVADAAAVVAACLVVEVEDFREAVA